MKASSLLFSLTLCFCLNACTKQVAEKCADPANKSSAVDLKGNLFVCGYESNGKHYIAKYWRDGIGVSLTDGTHDAYATGIFVVNNDVYVSGYERNDAAHEVAKYWRNGTAVILSNQTKNNYATGIVVQNNNVYVSGYEDGSLHTAKYWLSGNEILLNTGVSYSEANSIFVDGDDVYVGGTAASALSSFIYAAYWKNGVLSFLPTAENSYLYSIFVKDNNIFTAGYLDPGIAAYWKNNNKTELTGFVAGSQHSESFSVFADGKNIYVAGMEFVSGFYRATCWKNNNPLVLAATQEYSAATSVVVKNTDVFTAGILDHYPAKAACYWHNADLVLLTDGFHDAGATQIFVTP